MPQFSSDIYKMWLYRRGTWELVDELSDKEFEKVFMSEHRKIITHGIDPYYRCDIYMRDFALVADEEPTYTHFVEFSIQGQIDQFYIADYPSYLQLVPQLIEHVEKALQLAQLVKHIVETGSVK